MDGRNMSFAFWDTVEIQAIENVHSALLGAYVTFLSHQHHRESMRYAIGIGIIPLTNT